MSTSQSPEKKKKRRPKGSGSLYKRGGIWWMRIGVGGEEDRQSTHQSNWNEAMKVLNAWAGDIRRGSVKPSQRKLRTNDLLDILSMDYEVQRRASWKTVEGHIKVLKAALGTRHATEVRYDDLQALALEWQKDGLSNATINRRTAALHRAYVLGRRAGKIAEVPNFPHLKEDNARQGFVEPADFDRFLYYLPDDGLRDFVDWLGVTGMRRGEAMKLQWSYLQKTPKGYELRIPASDTKNRRARVVPIVADLEPILDRRRKLRRLDCPLIQRPPDGLGLPAVQHRHHGRRGRGAQAGKQVPQGRRRHGEDPADRAASKGRMSILHDGTLNGTVCPPPRPPTSAKSAKRLARHPSSVGRATDS